MSLLLVLLAAAETSALVWHGGRLFLKGEPGKVEFFRIRDPLGYLPRLDPRSPVPPAAAGAGPAESRLCAPGVVELPREKGLYLAKCGGASALAVRSSVALVCAADGETVVAFCAGSATGAPRPGAELSFLAREKVLLSGRADDRGLFRAALAGPMTVVARDGDDLAFAVLRGLPPPSPAPVGLVALPGGAVAEGSSLFFFGLVPRDAGELLPVRAPGFGKTLVRADGTGAFSGRLEPRDARPGRRALRAGNCGVAFDVVRKEEEEFELSVEAAEQVAPGDEVRVEVAAREPFGPGVECTFRYAVVAERPGRGARLVARGEGEGEGKGRFSFPFRAREVGLYRVTVEARAKEGTRAASAEKVVRCGRGLALRVEPLYARAGEEVKARISRASGKVRLEYEGRGRELAADARGRAEATITFEREGIYEVRALSGGETARAEVRVYPTGAEALSLTPAAERVRPGRETRVLVEGAAGSALLLCASDRLWWAKVERLEGGRAEVRLRALDSFGPKVDLLAFAFRDGKLERAGRTLSVERGLFLTIEQHKEKVRLRLLDERGGPVAASVVAVVREAGGELPVPLDGLAPGFPAHVEAASSLDFASGGGGIPQKMRSAPRGRAPLGPAPPPRAPRPRRVDALVRLGPAAEASLSLPARETRGKREVVAYAFGEGGRCAVARAALVEEEVWGRVCAPGHLVEGDELRAELRLWNDSPKVSAPDAALRGEGVKVHAPRRASVSAGEAVSIPFIVRAVKPGRCAISSAFGRHAIDVFSRGRVETRARSGVLEGETSFSFPLPKSARGSRLVVAFAPTAADAVAQSRPAEPPSGAPRPEDVGVRGKLRTAEPEELPRLFARMDESGGFGWHGSRPDSLSTALAALRLKQLLPDSRTMLSRALDALGPLARADAHDLGRAFSAWVLARCGRDPGTISGSTPLGLAYAALAEEERGRHARAVELCRKLEATAERVPAGVRWGRKRARSETGSEELSTAAALRALLRVRPTSRLIPGAGLFLLESRKGLSWGGGMADREALAALREFSRSRPKGTLAGLTVAASEAGLTRVSVRAAGKEISKDIVWRRELPAGGPVEIAFDRVRRARVELSKKGPGRIPFSAWVEYRTARAGGKLRIERSYSNQRPRKGETIECTLRVRGRGTFERAVVRDFVPGGFEVVRAPGAELRPPEVVFHVPRLEGGAVFRYSLRARFEGTFTALAPLVEVVGTGLRGRGKEVRLEVGY